MNASLLRTDLRREPENHSTSDLISRFEILASTTKMPNMWPCMSFDNEPKAIVGDSGDTIAQVAVPYQPSFFLALSGSQRARARKTRRVR